MSHVESYIPFFEVEPDHFFDGSIPPDSAVQFTNFPDTYLRPFGFTEDADDQLRLKTLSEDSAPDDPKFKDLSHSVRVINDAEGNPLLIFQYLDEGLELEIVPEESTSDGLVKALYRVVRPESIYYGRDPEHQESEKAAFYIVGIQVATAIPVEGQTDMSLSLPNIHFETPTEKNFAFPRILGLIGDPTDPEFQKLHGLY